MKQLFILLFIISLNSFSQSMDLGKEIDFKKAFFVPENKELYYFYADSLLVIDFTKFKEIRKVKFSQSEIIQSLFFLSYQGSIYGVSGSGGMVYRFSDSIFKRIDRSFEHKMQYGSNIFVYNNTIYRYGGYGFWSMRNFFIYFDMKTLEWEVVPASGSKVLPEGSNASVLKVDGDQFYIFGGEIANKFNPNQFLANDAVWKFDFKEKSWELLGRNDYDWKNFTTTFPFKDKQVFTTKQMQNLHVVDVVNNKVQVFQKTSSQYFLFQGSETVFLDGVFYFLIRRNAERSMQLISRNEDEFFGKLLYEEPLYGNRRKMQYGFLALFVVLVSGFSYVKINRWRLKKNRIILEKDHILYKGKPLPFEKKSIVMIDLLLNSKNEVISRDILELVENKNLNYGHNTRVMNSLIEETNFKLKSVLGIENDLITYQKSDLDKRIKVYSIDKSYFFIK